MAHNLLCQYGEKQGSTLTSTITAQARVAELVDAADLKSAVRKDVPVRVRPWAPHDHNRKPGCRQSVQLGQVEDVAIGIAPHLQLSCSDRLAFMVRRNVLAVAEPRLEYFDAIQGLFLR